MSETRRPFLTAVVEQRPKPPPRAVAEAQVMELHNRIGSYDTRFHFKRGDLVQYKGGLNPIQRSDQDYVLVYWRTLRWWKHVDRAVAAAWVRQVGGACTDCVVAYVDDEGTGLTYMPADSRTLEPRRDGSVR